VRRLTVLTAAAIIAAGGWAATAPGQLGAGARVLAPPVQAGSPGVSAAIAEALSTARVIPNGRGPHLGARVLRRTGLRASPGGRLVTGIGPRTRFGGPQVVAVVAQRGRWLGVLHQWMPNGRAGWVRARDLSLVRQRWSIEVDRSARSGLVRLDGKVVDRFPVTVGRPGTETPLGRFAVTDRIATRPGSPYGCCILALSGRQPRLPSGWAGGDRLALHGSASDAVGAAASAGCVRLRERDLRWLMRRIPVGTRVTIRR